MQCILGNHMRQCTRKGKSKNKMAAAATLTVVVSCNGASYKDTRHMGCILRKFSGKKSYVSLYDRCL